MPKNNLIHYDIYNDCLEKQKQKKLYRHKAQDLIPLKPPYINVNGKKCINLSSNDYLGLSYNQEIKEAGIKAAEKYGNSTVSSRAISGGYDFFSKVEDKLAKFKGKQASIIGASGFQVGSSVLSALLKPHKNPLVFFDKYNHASLYFGVKHAGTTPIRYKHNDLDHLEELIKKYSAKNPESAIFIVTESLFSMDGDFCDLEKLTKIAEKYNAFTIVDDAHSVGVYGKEGRGLTYDYQNIDVVLGTCSKAMGCFGGYVACNNDIADYLRNFAGGLIYSTALPPSIWGMIDKALDIIPTMEKDRNIIQDFLISDQLGRFLGDICSKYGSYESEIKINSHIIPVILGSNENALKSEKDLVSKGFYVKAIRSPTVPEGTARLRLSLNQYMKLL